MDSWAALQRIHNIGLVVRHVATSNTIRARAFMLAPPRAPIVIVAAATSAIVLFIGTAVPLTEGVHRAGFGPYGAYSTLVAIVWCAMYSLATSRISARDAKLLIHNFWLTREIPAGSITRVGTDSGVAVEVEGGKTYGSTAYGSSVIQAIFGSRRYEKAAQRLRDWVAECSGTVQHTVGVRSHVRASILPGILFAWAIAFLYELIIWKFGGGLRPALGIPD
jgi:hypothetical protein